MNEQDKKNMQIVIDRINQSTDLTDDQKADMSARFQIAVHFKLNPEFRQKLSDYVWEKTRESIKAENGQG